MDPFPGPKIIRTDGTLVGCVQYSCTSGEVTTLCGEMKQVVEHDNDSGCGDDSASSYGSSSSSSNGSNGTASELHDNAAAAVNGAANIPAADNGKSCTDTSINFRLVMYFS